MSRHWLFLPWDTICPQNIVMFGLELLLWGLWMARGQLFLAIRFMPQAGTASETTQGPLGLQLLFANPWQALLCSWVGKGIPSHHLRKAE